MGGFLVEKGIMVFFDWGKENFSRVGWGWRVVIVI